MPENGAAALCGGNVCDVGHCGALRGGRQAGTEAVHGVVQVVSQPRTLPRVLCLRTTKHESEMEVYTALSALSLQ